MDTVVKSQETYNAVRTYIVAARKQVTAAVNSAMVTAYWNIGKQIYELVEKTNALRTESNFLYIYLISLQQNLEKVSQLQILGICDSFSLHLKIATQCVAN